jgi:hypothetical protein
MREGNRQRIAWLKNLKPGDDVGVQGNTYNDTSIYKVKKITPTGLIVVCTRYNNSVTFDPEGVERGANWLRRRILVEATPELFAKVEQRKLSDDMSKVVFSSLTLDQLTRIRAILEEKEE